jgi:putative transposase
MITYQFRIYPTKKQRKLINLQLEEHRQLYNYCLKFKSKLYKLFGKNISAFDLIKRFVKKFKKQSNYSALQQTVRRLDKSYKAFFKKHGGFPRYKKLFKTIEYSKYGDGCKLSDNNTILYLQNIGKIKVKNHRKIEHKIKTLSITYKNGIYHVNVICSTSIYCNDIHKNIVKSVGIDFGIKHLISTSDKEQIFAPKPLSYKLKSLAKAQRKKNYKVANKIYKKITNIRKDFNHKLSRKLVNKYDVICLEDISSKDWLTNIRNINRTISDINIGQLINFIVYKAESAGKRIMFVNPSYTTQQCSKCGKMVEKTLKERVHKCSCGFVCDRDLNASYNILRLGLQSLTNKICLEAS